MVRDLLSDKAIPFLPELPARGPGADLIGRTAAQLVGFGVDLQPSGWRLIDAPGLDARRAGSYLREDVERFAEIFEGYQGPLKVQWCGPWTLAASIWLPRGERVVTDPGATRDLVQSLGETVREQLKVMQRLVPGARLILQWDEPALPSVLAGSLPTASGYGRARAIEPDVVGDALISLTASIDAHEVTEQLLHCCAPAVPVPLIRRVADLSPALDTSLVRPRQWDGLAELVESGRRLWAGVAATDGTVSRPEQLAEPFLRQWRDVGLAAKDLSKVVLTPACGLAGANPRDVPRLFKLLAQAADIVGEAGDR